MRRTIEIVMMLGLLGLGACGKSNGSSSSDVVKAPTELTAVPLIGGAHLMWKDNSNNESQFMIERKSASADWMTVGMVPFNITEYHDPGVTAGMTYTYRVMAMPKSGGDGPYSNEVMFTAPAGTAGMAGTTSSGTAGTGAAGTSSGHDAHHAAGGAGGA